MPSREKRIFHNEELFREINAHIAELEDRMSLAGELLSLMCECASIECTSPIEVEHETFREVRTNPLRFLVAAGHERLEAETVVEQGSSYVIVEKRDPGPA